MRPQSVFPLVDETTANLKLVGSVTRRDLYLYLWALFAQVHTHAEPYYDIPLAASCSPRRATATRHLHLFCPLI